jgi:hypothetical protein
MLSHIKIRGEQTAQSQQQTSDIESNQTLLESEAGQSKINTEELNSLIEGSIKGQDGSIQLQNDLTLLPDGSIPLPDSSVRLADKSIRLPNGLILEYLE